MRRFLILVSLAVTMAIGIGTVLAQVPSPIAAVPPQTAYVGSTDQSFRLLAPTPSDAYRQGLISRWDLERIEGPLPQALQGPSPDGGNQGGGDRND